MRPSLALGLLALALCWLSPLPALASHSFAAHMTMHMGVVAVAAPLVAMGVATTRFDPALRWPAFLSPIPLSVIELIVVWGWHAPALHHLARHEPLVRLLEQGSFALSGFALWIAVLGGEPRDPSRRASGLLALLLTSMHMTLLGALVALPNRALYAHAGIGMSAIEDQQLGGSIMLTVGGAVYLAGGLWLASGLLRGSEVRG